MNELEVVGVRVELPTNLPIVLLREQAGERFLPIWVGKAEANAIVNALEHAPAPARPLTHDLFLDTLKALGRRLTEVRITSLQGSIFFAELVFDGGVAVQARPSDGIALALRCDSFSSTCG